jgi:UDP-N-acetylglucosamine 2-epimerase (non-hydrolysing)
MKNNLKIMLVTGARPNFMKIAPLISAIKGFNSNTATPHHGNTIQYLLVHTGQHYDVAMSETFFNELEIPRPDINLEVGSGSHAAQTAEIMKRFEPVLMKEQPDVLVVVGDVNSTMATTLVASKLGVKVAHVEAGLRSFDRTMPEEINRLVTDALSDLLFTPSPDADENLLHEGISAIKIKRVGNIMIDTLVNHLDKARQKKPYQQFDLTEKSYVFVTLHRPSNVDNGGSLRVVMGCLNRLSEKLPVIFPVHPRTRKNLERFGLMEELNPCKKLILCEPLGYHETIGLVDNARFVLTDSGGLQEETTFLNVPCLTLRPNTERPITIHHGTNKLTSLEVLEQDFDYILNGHHPSGKIPDLWDGHTAERIVEILSKM